MERIQPKLTQIALSLVGGLGAAIEGTIQFFPLCVAAILLDVLSALALGKRMHRKDPTRYDGKFKSNYKYRVMLTFFILFIVLIAAYYVDTLVLPNNEQDAVRYSMVAFLIYQGWSIAENCSSESNSRWAQALQRVMINKAERHLNVEIKDIFEKEENDDCNS